MKTGKSLMKKAGKLAPRVGNKYQADNPPLIEKCDYLQLVKTPVVDPDATIDQPNSSSLDKPIKVERKNCKDDNLDGDTELGNSEERMSTPLKNENLSSVEPDSELDQVKKGLFPVPGSARKAWTEIEEESFLLGLYLFGKNLVLVKRFVGSKTMGDILCFYYGEFYNSDGYRRWSECWESKDRNVIYGRKIFTESRHNKLLSRLFSHVSKDKEDVLIESYTNFNDKKISFEDYVFALKDIVGISALVEAVGINSQRLKLRNLTASNMEPMKTSNMLSVESEIPFTKAYSALTPAEIINFLTGDSRLSKAQTKAFFWNAVWPRLLARGWHCERLKNHIALGLKHSLVFLVYRVLKFSRELVKGKHYFNSIRDVLNKVASRPKILESKKKRAEKLVQDDWSSSNEDVMKYTVLDTSNLDEAEQPKLTDLKSLPAQTVNVDTSSALSSENERNESENSEDEGAEIETLNHTENTSENGTCVDSSNCETSILNTSMPDSPEPVKEAEKTHEGQKTVSIDDNSHESPSPSPLVESHLSEKMNHELSRMQDSTACGHEKSSLSIENQYSLETKQIEDDLNRQDNLANASKDMEVQVVSQNSSAVSSLAKDGGSNGSNKGTFADSPLDGEVTSLGSPPPRILFDLNVPYVPPDLETESNTDMIQINDNSCERRTLIDLNLPYVSSDTETDTDMMKRQSFPPETSQHPEQLNFNDTEASKDDQPMLNSRRQSIRSRSMTKRALESLESEFFNTKIRKKGVEFSENNSIQGSRE